MDTVICWFSGTGNSLWAARRLAGSLDGARLAPLATAGDDVAEGADALGLVFPCYCFGPPLIVERFLQRVRVRPETRIFTVVTNGGLLGSTNRQVRARLRARGLGLAAGWSLKMPGNCIYLYGAWSEKRQGKMFARAGEKLARITAALRSKAGGPVEGTPRPVSWVLDVVRAGGRKHYLPKDSHFRVTEACTSCGLCERICPVGDIRIEAGRPVWQGACEQCYACIQFCPVEAIQIGEGTPDRKRYHHPEVNARELCVRGGGGGG
jgi:ferredoxin